MTPKTSYGAIDFILKPWLNEKLIATISTAIKFKKSYKDVDKLRKAKQMLEEQISQREDRSDM